MTKINIEKLFACDVDPVEIVSSLSTVKRGDLESATVSRFLTDLDEKGNLKYGSQVWSTALGLLPADSLFSLKTVLHHLDLFCLYEMDDDDREHYFEEVNKAVDYLVRPYAYLNPEELVLNVAHDITGREISIEDSLEEKELIETRRLTELIVGGGHYVNVLPPSSVKEIVDDIEMMVL